MVDTVIQLAAFYDGCLVAKSPAEGPFNTYFYLPQLELGVQLDMDWNKVRLHFTDLFSRIGYDGTIDIGISAEAPVDKESIINVLNLNATDHPLYLMQTRTDENGRIVRTIGELTEKEHFSPRDLDRDSQIWRIYINLSAAPPKEVILLTLPFAQEHKDMHSAIGYILEHKQDYFE